MTFTLLRGENDNQSIAELSDLACRRDGFVFEAQRYYINSPDMAIDSVSCIADIIVDGFERKISLLGGHQLASVLRPRE